MEQALIWVIEDDDALRFVYQKALQDAGFRVMAFNQGHMVTERIKEATPQVIITDVKLPDVSGLDLLEKIKGQYPEIPVIVVSAFSDFETTSRALKLGAFDVLAKPFPIENLLDSLRHALARPSAVGKYVSTQFFDLVGESPAMQSVYKQLTRLIDTTEPVVLVGEAGTGKSHIAGVIHRYARTKHSIVFSEAAVVTERDIENVFSGGIGTWVIRHVHLLKDSVQRKLIEQLKLISGKSDGEPRLILISEGPLKEYIPSHDLEPALSEMLSTFELFLPPLRERGEDILILARYFLIEAAKQIKTSNKAFNNKSSFLLLHYPWPGNIRELRQLCYRLAAQDAMTLLPNDLPSHFHQQEILLEVQRKASESITKWVKALIDTQEKDIYHLMMNTVENIIIDESLGACRGRKIEAAKLIGIGRNTMTRKLQAREKGDID